MAVETPVKNKLKGIWWETERKKIIMGKQTEVFCYQMYYEIGVVTIFGSQLQLREAKFGFIQSGERCQG